MFKVISYGAIRLHCRGGCGVRDMDGIDNLEAPKSLGWTRIVCVEGTLSPLPTRWWTHIGTCPHCLNKQTGRDLGDTMRRRIINMIWIVAILVVGIAVIKCLPEPREPIQVDTVWRSPEIQEILDSMP